MNTKNLIDSVFALLDKWRYLPSYQLERRADIFFALFLPEIIKRAFGVEIKCIIPEFPVRIGNIRPELGMEYSNRSYKIDYVAVAENDNSVYFIELKTDDASRSEKQDKYLRKAKKKNIKDLVDGVLKISQASSSRKYGNLLTLLHTLGWVDSDLQTSTSRDYHIEIVYIQPTVQPDATQSNVTIITFDMIADFLSNEEDAFTKRFVESLKKWKISPNK
jgi:hypothetical protein